MWTCAALHNSHVPDGEAEKYNHKFPIATCNCHVLRKRFSAERGADGENGNCRGRLKGVECRGAQVQRHSDIKVQRHSDTERNVKYGY
jgi:hypothetical protein